MGSFKLEFRGRNCMRKRAALSEVISSVILAGVVLSIGGALWSYSMGAAGIMADTYIDEVLETMNTVTERFMVEHVNVSASGNELTVWVYNYGDTPISVNVTASLESEGYNITVNDYQIGKDRCWPIDLDFTSNLLQQGDDVAITVVSRRRNNVYYTHFVE
jgi:hypothetical protein